MCPTLGFCCGLCCFGEGGFFFCLDLFLGGVCDKGVACCDVGVAGFDIEGSGIELSCCNCWI